MAGSGIELWGGRKAYPDIHPAAIQRREKKSLEFATPDEIRQHAAEEAVKSERRIKSLEKELEDERTELDKWRKIAAK